MKTQSRTQTLSILLNTYLIATVAISLTALLLAGFISLQKKTGVAFVGWTTFRGSFQRTGVNTEESSLLPPLQKVWTRLQGEPELADANVVIEASPLIYQDRVFVATIGDFDFDTDYDSSIVALDLHSGNILWSKKLGLSGIWATPTIDSRGVLYAATFDGYVFALHTTDGAIVWKKQVVTQPQEDRLFRTSPIVMNGLLYIGSYNGSDSRLYVLNTLNGAILANRLSNGPVYASPVAISNNTIGFVISLPDRNSRLEVYPLLGDLSTSRKADIGNPLWTYTFDGDSLSTPVYYQGKIFHRSGWWWEPRAESSLYVIDAQTGRDVVPPLDIASGGYMSSPAIDGERLYVTNDKTTLAAYNLGRLLSGDRNPLEWIFQVPDGGPIVSSPTVANGYMYFSTDDIGYDPTGETSPEGVLYALNARDGSLAWSYEAFKGVGSAQGSPAISDGYVIFVSYDDNARIDHGVHAFRAQ